MLAPHPSTARGGYDTSRRMRQPRGGRSNYGASLLNSGAPPARGRANDDSFTSRPRYMDSAEVAATEKPWQSNAVAALAARAKRGGLAGGGGGESAEPMIIEGPRGTSLRAVGNAEDHKVAGDALAQCYAERKARQQKYGGPELLLPAPGSEMTSRLGLGGRSAEAEDAMPPSNALGRGGRRTARQRSDYVFGAVYEHVDSCGRPRVIGSTDKQPERAYLEDGRNHTGVAALLTLGRGASNVVWAGVGSRTAGVGEGEVRPPVFSRHKPRARTTRHIAHTTGHIPHDVRHSTFRGP
mmetsp:Transcript_33327/g.88170  ORF Transcript_33327/g.88170 Transcript_33327/m.88170 type:complete len:296 (+) Transcript_33327:616-1503(+)